MDQFPHKRKAVEGYVTGQLDVDVAELDHVEQVQEHWIGQEQYEIWDCHTRSDGRWWVVTPFTNLYPQTDFKSADYTLTFHIGLTQRVMWKSDGPPAVREGYEGLDALFRQTEQAMDKAHQVIEVADAQAAGVALRECLVTLCRALVEIKPEIATENPGLKRGDFVATSEAAADYLLAGGRLQKHRAYLKSSAKHAWQYVNWLAHDRHGAPGEAEMGGQFVQRVVMDFSSALFAHGAEPPEQCPQCDSRRLSWDTDYVEDGYSTSKLCEACSWRSDPEWTQHSAPSEPREELAVEGPCTPSSDGPGRAI